jgi:hypothetical protein
MTQSGDGTSETVRFEIDNVRHYTTIVTMPNGEMRYFTNRVRPEYDTEQGRRFGCAWEYVSAVIIPPRPTIAVPVGGLVTVECVSCGARIGEVCRDHCVSWDMDALELPADACVRSACVGCADCC